jgi:hypothetical protein
MVACYALIVIDDDSGDTELRNVISSFTKLSRDEQAVALARFAFELTIAARDTYVPGSTAVQFPERLRALNEIQHRVTGRLVDILLGRGWNEADEYVWGIAFETARHAGCIEYVRFACRRALPS